MPESMPAPSMPEPSSMDPSSVVPVSPPVAPVSVEPVSVEPSVEPALGSWAATPRARRRRARAVERRSPSIASGGWIVGSDGRVVGARSSGERSTEASEISRDKRRERESSDERERERWRGSERRERGGTSAWFRARPGTGFYGVRSQLWVHHSISIANHFLAPPAAIQTRASC